MLRGKTEDRVLVVAGLLGLAVAAGVACDGSRAGAEKTAASAPENPVTGAPASTGAKPECSVARETAANTAAVVAAATALLDKLPAEQKNKLHLAPTLANAEQWSNFPAGFIRRNGVKLGDMTPDAEAAALLLVKVAAGDAGFAMFDGVRAADGAFAAGSHDSGLFGPGEYYVSVHGTPSTSTPWMLQIAGHHLAYNLTYGASCTSATPLFDGAQPTTWKDANGAVHAPLEKQRAALAALLSSVSSSPDAKLAGTFTDMINGPASHGPPGGGGGGPPPGGGHGPGFGPPFGQDGGGGGHDPKDGIDSNYPAGLTYPAGTTGRGTNVGALTPEQKTLVRAAIEAWVANVADPVSKALLAVYESDDALGQTYVAYSGATDLSATRSYARIDGPRVWIELTVQEGTVDTPAGHYHSIWRDKAADYGAEYVAR